MNILRRTFAGLLLVTSFSFALVPVQAASTPADPYALAVASYVEAATKEIDALRVSGEAAKQALPENLRTRFQAFEAKIKACEQLLEALRSATPGTFDVTKGKYERARAEAVAELKRAQTS